MSELTHPLPVEGGRAEPHVHAGEHVRPSRAPSFTELVYAHFDWWKDGRGANGNSEAARRYRETLTHFEERHGELVSAYWCSHIESAAALTERPARLPWGAPIVTFHRESDWATQNVPDVARELHRCDALAVRAQNVLTGVRRTICLRLVMASAAHLLALVDDRAAHANEEHFAAALDQEREGIDKAEEYYCQAANGQSQIIYFLGMVTVALAISVVSLLVLTIGHWSAGVAALIAGSVGAVVSVIQRINAGQFDLEYDVGRPYAFFLGGLRPMIGGAFAVALSFAFTSGILHLPIAENASTSDRHLALFVISFLAGFSERFAQDTLASALPALEADKKAAPPAKKTGA